MSLADVYGDEFWSANKAAGFLDSALVKQTGAPATVVDVKLIQPSQRRFDGAVISQDYEIKYRYADLPKLAEGDTVSILDADGAVIRSKRFKVRETPYVPDETQGASGFFRHALLTRIV